MARVTTILASAVVGGLLFGNVTAHATPGSPGAATARVVPSSLGSIQGVVRDERGEPVAGVVISALGTSTTVAVTHGDGRFEFATLAPGLYASSGSPVWLCSPPNPESAGGTQQALPVDHLRS